MPSRKLCLLMLPGLATALLTPAWAQRVFTTIDRGHSYASFWTEGATETSAPVNVAVAQAAGTAALDVKKPAASTLAFNLVPGGEGADLLAPDGTIREDVVARIMRYTVLSFQSTQTRVRPDGRLEFSGQLTATHVTREQIPAAWNSANSVPSYTNPVTTRTTRTVTFVLSTPRAEFLAAQLQKHQAFVATGTTDSGVFPELSAALLDSYWPIVAQDEQCEFPTDTAGRRDYSGGVCTGKAISTTNASPAPPSFGRDYSGRPRVDARANGSVTILLYLKLIAADAQNQRPPSN